MSLRFLVCAVFAVCHRTQTCCGFNIDERFAVIKEGKTKGSLFGFSVALHQQTVGTKQPLLLVGAPKEKANLLKGVNETGAVYSCPVTTETTDCTRINLVKKESNDIVEGMWLGVTVASQRGLSSGRMMACGHRYIKLHYSGTEAQQRMVGKCYVRSNDLTYDASDEWQTYKYEFCDPSFNEELEGMCNMGISGGMTETDIYTGAPGTYFWQGNVHVLSRDPDPVKVWNDVESKFEELQLRNIYMGYSVLEEKKLLSSDDYTVVTGAPRDQSKGSVMLGQKDRTKIELVKTIYGEQVGSYFGSSLAVTDLNNDDWNDLIVGAPFYFDRTKDEGGAVYVFMNENGSFQSTATRILRGSSQSGFGFAVAPIGDVNQDGFQDFAVGAPFHKTGEVYIWMGSKQGISQNRSQVIEGKSVNETLKTFGYSVSGGMDMDDNSYPDILVGSLDDQVVLLRARPVIHLTKNFTAEPKIVDPSQCVENTPCVTVSICMSFTLSNGNKYFKKNITVDYKVAADIDKTGVRRVQFEDSRSEYSGSMSLPSYKSICQTLKLSVMKSLKDKLEPVVFSLSVALQGQTATSRRSLQNLDSFPVLSQGQKLTERTEINFKKECGSDNKCTSNLQMTAQFVDEKSLPCPRQGKHQVLQFKSNMNARVHLQVNVTNFPSPGRLAEDAHQTTLEVSIPKGLVYAAFRPVDGRFDCNSVDNTVHCDLGNPLKGNEMMSLQLWFETYGIDLYTKEVKSELRLYTISEQDDLRPVSVVLLIENTVSTTFSVGNPLIQTKFGGAVMGESAMSNTSNVGSFVEFNFNVDMNDKLPRDLGVLAVEFEWPFEVTNGKWLLYLTKITVIGESQVECDPPGKVVNLLNLTLTESRSTRKRREITGEDAEETLQSQMIEPQAAISMLKNTKKLYELNCFDGTANCVTFSCPLLNMKSKSRISVQSRLWNSTMLEDYFNALRVTVRGKATLKLITEQPHIKMDSLPITFTVEIDPEVEPEISQEFPFWIIVSAALAGLLLLGFIVVLLWKIGFFDRKVPPPRRERAEMKIQPSEKEKLTDNC